MVFAIHWHESAMDLHVFPILNPPPAFLPTPSLWVFPVHQPWALVSCIQPGLEICFTLDSILVSMLFSQNIPPSPSPTESQSLFCTRYIYRVEYHSAIKENSFESLLMRWMKWEPIIQSEVSQKDKDQYSILMHIYGIEKDGNHSLIK